MGTAVAPVIRVPDQAALQSARCSQLRRHGMKRGQKK